MVLIFAGWSLLSTQVRVSQRAAFAPSTLDNLRCKIRAYILFCLFYKVTDFPANLQTICNYAQFLARTFNSIQSVQNYISSVKLLHIVSGFPFPHISTLEYKLLIKGLTKLNPFIPRQALPITPLILLKIHSLLDLNNPSHATYWCLFVLAFFLFARKSNMVPPSRTRFDPAKHLCRRDLLLDPKQVIVYFKWSKTMQQGDRYILVPLVPIPGSPLCPHSAVINMFSKVPAPPHSPAFVIPHGSKLSSVTHATFTSTLRTMLARAGHNPAGYSGHSFRRGGASFALSVGVPGELIMKHGDWKSDCYLRYLDNSVQDRQKVSKIMAGAISGHTF